MPERAGGEDQKGTPTTLLGTLTEHYGSLAAALALVFFGWLAAMYDEFYREFAISAADVGMSYTDTLTRSWGAIILVTLSLTGAITLVRLCLYWRQRREWGRDNARTPKPSLLSPPHPSGRSYVVLICIVLILAGLIGERKMSWYAESAKKGNAVQPPRFAALVVFDVRAQPVTEIVSVSDSAVKVPATGLTYLGNNDRSFVLYCIRDEKILKISMERFTLRTSPGRGAKARTSGSCANRIHEPSTDPPLPPKPSANRHSGYPTSPSTYGRTEPTFHRESGAK